jgi:hypothetical protein
MEKHFWETEHSENTIEKFSQIKKLALSCKPNISDSEAGGIALYVMERFLQGDTRTYERYVGSVAPSGKRRLPTNAAALRIMKRMRRGTIRKYAEIYSRCTGLRGAV